MPIAKEFYDMMEKFEVYSFDSIYYTLEEIEAMGLSLYDYEGLKKLLDEKDQHSYTVVSHSSVSETKSSLHDYLGNMEQDETVFMKDYGDYGFIIDFKHFYGIEFRGNVVLYGDSRSRNDKYEDIARIMANEIQKAKEKNGVIKDTSNEFRRQLEITKGKNKLLEITHNREN